MKTVKYEDIPAHIQKMMAHALEEEARRFGEYLAIPTELQEWDTEERQRYYPNPLTCPTKQWDFQTQIAFSPDEPKDTTGRYAFQLHHEEMKVVK